MFPMFPGLNPMSPNKVEMEFEKVVHMVQGDGASIKVISEAWDDFGRSLGLGEAEINCLREKLKSGKVDLYNVPGEILRTWRIIHKNYANLDALYQALIDIGLENLAGSIRERFGRGSDMVLPPPSKKPKLMDQDHADDELDLRVECSSFSGDSSLSDEDDDIPLFRAIRDGESLSCIENILNKGADVNITESYSEQNAAHIVIQSLINESLNKAEALDILNLLMSKGFDLINFGDNDGYTPLHDAMEWEDLDEEFLDWFRHNGVNFNAKDENGDGDSVLFHAISNGRRMAIIRKIIACGANPYDVNHHERNALHISVQYAHVSAMRMFIEKFGVNTRDDEYRRPLHFLFSENDLDYMPCLLLLLERGANFNVKCSDVGEFPLVKWIWSVVNGVNPFPVLMMMKDVLPITEEMASIALSTIVKAVKHNEKFSKNSDVEANGALAQFFRFLIQEKRGKLKGNDGKQWKPEQWEIKYKEALLKPDFLQKLKDSGCTPRCCVNPKK